MDSETFSSKTEGKCSPLTYILKGKWDCEPPPWWHPTFMSVSIVENRSSQRPFPTVRQRAAPPWWVFTRFTGDGPGSSSYTRPPDNIQLHAVPSNYRSDSGEGLWRCLRHAAILLTSQWYTFLRIDSKWPSWIRTSEKQVFLWYWENTSVYGFPRLCETHPDAIGGKEERKDRAGMLWGRGTSSCPLPQCCLHSELKTCSSTQYRLAKWRTHKGKSNGSHRSPPLE